MASKRDLEKRNRKLRHTVIKQRREEKVREKKIVDATNKKLALEASKSYTKYPPLVLTMLKRIRRISPFQGIASLDPYEATLITFYKLKQNNINEIRIGANAAHAWCEFKFDDDWYILDPVAVRDSSLGQTVKKVSEANSRYTQMSRYYESIESYYEDFSGKISYDYDEAMIYAMEDIGLTSIMNLNYH